MKEIEGNLLDLFDAGVFDVIAHGCNCHLQMTGGIAASIATRYPFVERADNETSIMVPEKLGTVTFVQFMSETINQPQCIANAYTQFAPGRADPTVLYPSIRSCMQKIHRFTARLDKIGLPLIGCGIAGGDWEIVSKIIEEELYDRDVTIVRFKPQEV